MIRSLFIPALLCAAAQLGSAASAPTVGGGAPTAAIQQSFASAFNRKGFSALVNLPPVADVRALGTPGLVQEFPWAANSSLKAALVKPDPTAPLSGADTLQIYADLYTYYSSIGVVTAGYPTNDTAACPSSFYGVCNYQLFTKNYALFVYSSPSVSYTLTDPFYTEWNNGGGMSGLLAAPISAPVSVTSESGAAGTQQLFTGGGIYFWSATASPASSYTVAGSVFTAFREAGGLAVVGFPTSEEVVLTSGQHQQTFENGRILWTPGAPAAVIFPVGNIIINVPSSITLTIGGSFTLTATVIDSLGNLVTGRAITWSTSNGNAVTIQGNGYTATLRAVGAGTARIQVSGEGRTSLPLVVSVTGQCCAVGEGAPTQTITQAFQAAVTRNHLSLLLPNPTPVVRSGAGYIQIVAAANGSGAPFVIAAADTSAFAWVLTGTLYSAYLANGGFSGPLGYPASDASPGGTQAFISGAALSGSPVRVVPVPMAAKWLASGAETGPLGTPTGDSASFASLSGTTGNAQAFAAGAIYGITNGSRAGLAFASSGLILARYTALNGPAGLLGIPVSDLFTSGAALRQDFEAGYIDVQPGATAAVEHFNPRTPSLSASPATVTPGGRVHIAISGFTPGASITVSLTGQTDFTVTAPLGVFGWDIVVPSNAVAATVTIQARAAPAQVAAGSYAIIPVAQLRPSLTVISGDLQNGAPGAVLASPLIAVVTGSGGTPLAGVPVSWSVSPGASATVSPATDVNGQISATLRLQPSSGIALLSVSAAGQTLTFSALSNSKTIAGFPAFSQTNNAGSLVAALAATLRYYQNAGVLGLPHGLATPAALTNFLASNAGFTFSEAGAAVANPWVAAKFAGVAGGIAIEPVKASYILDLVNAGSPLVLTLQIQIDGTPAGGFAVNAIGINSDASIAIADPNPAWARTSLADYLNGFSVQGHSIQASLTGVIQVVPSLAAPAGFVSTAPVPSAQSAVSSSGPCTNSIDLSGSTGAVRFIECDGTESAYQLAFATQAGATIIDLADGPPLQIAPESALAWQVTRAAGSLAIAPQTLAIASVVNAAGFGPGLTAGGFFTIFGAGLTVGNSQTSVSVNGQQAQVIAAFPYQLNALLPSGTKPGPATLTVTGPLGTVTQSVTTLNASPGIFGIVNLDGTLNSPANPIARGSYVSIYATGLGATAAQGLFQVVTAGVSVAIGSGPGTVLLKPSFAGLAPGFPGLYQINVQLPPSTVPGSQVALSLLEAGQTSNIVSIAIE